MLKQRAQTTQAYKSAPCTSGNSPLNKCQLWEQTGQASSQNRSDRLPKPVRPVAKTGQTALVSRPHPQKPKMQKKCTSSPLTLEIGSRYAMQLFSTFLSSPCCQCMNQGTNLKRCNLELLKYTTFITRCYTCPNEQVRYSTAS
jgi:ribosomal protein S27E